MFCTGRAATLSALLTTALASVALVPRQDYQRGENATYTSPIGLDFDVYPYTGNRTDLNVIGGNGVDANNVTHCMDLCTRQGDGKVPCVAIVYGIPDERCYMLDHTMNSTDILESHDYAHSAIVTNVSSFLNLDASCPYSNESTQATLNGLDFKVSCSVNIDRNDMNPWIPTNGTYEHHSDSFQDCMQFCSTMHPKCYGVSYDRGMALGYRNCYPKDQPTEVNAIMHSDVFHSALAIFDSNPSTACTPDSQYEAPGGVVFNVTCDHVAAGQNISAVNEQSFGACMDSCATYVPPQGQTGGECNAVLYQPSADDGYENCYLQVTALPSAERSGWRLGLRVDSNGQATSNDGGDGDSGNKAWIAGPVIGAVVAIAILLAACFWWRKRQLRKVHGQLRATSNSKPHWRQCSELDANFTERKELETRQPLAAESSGSVRSLHASQRGESLNVP